MGSTEVRRSCCTGTRQSTNPRLQAQQEYFALGSRTAVTDPNPATTASSSRGLDEQSRHHRALPTQNLTEEFKVWETHLSRSHQHVNTKRRQPRARKSSRGRQLCCCWTFPRGSRDAPRTPRFVQARTEIQSARRSLHFSGNDFNN